MKNKRKFRIGVAFFVSFLLLAIGARAQTPERIEPIKTGEAKNVNFVLEPNGTKKYIINLIKDTKLKIVYEMPPLDGDPTKAPQPLTQPTDSSYTSHAGADKPLPKPETPPTTLEWELYDNSQKITSGSNAKEVTGTKSGGWSILWIDREKVTNIPANGDYVVTVKCVAQSKCDNFIRLEVHNQTPIPANPNDPEE